MEELFPGIGIDASLDQNGLLRAQAEIAHAEAVECRLLVTDALLILCKQDDEFRQDIFKSLENGGVEALIGVEVSPLEKAAARILANLSNLFRR